MRASILLIGAGGHARACIDVVEQEDRWAIAGLVGLQQEVGMSVLGYRVLGSDADLPVILRDVAAALVTVGQIKSSLKRIQLFEALVAGGCEMPVVVSPRAYVSRHARVGAGTIIMHGAVVNAAAEVGRNCIINSQALVEHDAMIGDHCHIATGAAVNSGVFVGTGSFIGSGSTVRQQAVIGEHCVIGMGQRVLADCVPGSQLPAPRSRP
jgi:sugar O-acyltransferase (sialic acid O-acetyltransferase NeuD family)